MSRIVIDCTPTLRNVPSLACCGPRYPMPVYRKLAVATEVYGFKPLNWRDVPGQKERYGRIVTYWDATITENGSPVHYRDEREAAITGTGYITGRRTGTMPDFIGRKFISTDTLYRKTAKVIEGTLMNINTYDDVGTYRYELFNQASYESPYSEVAGVCASLSFDEVEWPAPSQYGGTRNKLWVVYDGGVYEHTGWSLGTNSLASCGLGGRMESLESYFYFLKDQFPDAQFNFGAWRREYWTHWQAEADATEIVFVKGQGRISDSRACKQHLLGDDSLLSCEKNLGPATGLNTVTAEPRYEWDLRGNYARVFWNKLFPVYSSYPPCCGA